MAEEGAADEGSDICSDLEEEEKGEEPAKEEGGDVGSEEEDGYSSDEDVVDVRTTAKRARATKLIDSDESDDEEVGLEEREENKADVILDENSSFPRLRLEITETMMGSESSPVSMDTESNSFPPASQTCYKHNPSHSEAREEADQTLVEVREGDIATNGMEEESSKSLIAIESNGDKTEKTDSLGLKQPERKADVEEKSLATSEDSVMDGDSTEMSFQWGQSLPLAQRPSVRQQDFLPTGTPGDILGEASQWQVTPMEGGTQKLVEDETQILDKEGLAIEKNFHSIFYCIFSLFYTPLLFYSPLLYSILHFSIPFSTPLFYSILFLYSILHSYSILFLYSILHSSILFYSSIPFSTPLFYSIPLFHSPLLYSIVFLYSILHSSILFFLPSSILFSSPLVYSILHSSILFSSPLLYSILHSSILFSSLLYSILHSSILFSSPLLYSILHSSILFSTPLFYSILFSTPLFYSLLHSSILFSSPLLYSILHSSILFSTPLFYSPLLYSILFSTPLFYFPLLYSILFSSPLLYSILFSTPLFYSPLLFSIFFLFFHSTILTFLPFPIPLSAMPCC